MRPEARHFAALAAALLALATIVGALTAHAARSRLPAAQYEVLQTAVHYQFFHSVGLLGVSALLEWLPLSALRTAAWLLSAGIVLFSGSLYALIAGVPGPLRTFVGILTPVGGLALIAAWLLVAVVLVRARRAE